MKKLNGSSYQIHAEVCANIPTLDGNYKLILYSNNQDEKEHLAIVYGEVKEQEGVLVRVHSECFTGEVLGSQRCDCGEQLQKALQTIAETGSGVVIYLRQEGRGIGLADKLRAYNLQDIGYDTVDANLALGHLPDEREYTAAALILKDLQVASIRLLTNNPAKMDHLHRLGVHLLGRIPLEVTVTPVNADYLFTKVERMNHLLDLVPVHYSPASHERYAAT
jgi:GTP cyclohydrolase II